MEIFVLMGVVAAEDNVPPSEALSGDMLLGVYSSCEEATNAHDVYARGTYEFDHYYVSRRVIDAPADNTCDGNLFLPG